MLKTILPLSAVALLLAACGDGYCNNCDKHRDQHGNAYYHDRDGVTHPSNTSSTSDDPLSDRSLGNNRGSHNEPYTNKDETALRDRDDRYHYVPAYYYDYGRGAYYRRY